MQSLGALIARVRESRADALAADALALYTHAMALMEATPPDTPETNSRKATAHRLAARAELLTARSYRWRPAPAKH
ncbi:hypothetical protein ACLQ2N_08290 [Streptomyces sp. DT224]|uniref:hypothetical protein n=1 Tax=Streptomyces sp. DT224 TaxID=3393426 RepID=UPI003CF60D12